LQNAHFRNAPDEVALNHAVLDQTSLSLANGDVYGITLRDVFSIRYGSNDGNGRMPISDIVLNNDARTLFIWFTADGGV
jgi:hypothetical protein